MADTIKLDAANDTSKVFVPVTGNIGFAPYGTTCPTAEQGKAPDLKLDEAFKGAGLIQKDGGFEWTGEADGDPLEFHQEGYSIPSGGYKSGVKFTMAQTDIETQSLIRGLNFDEHGHAIVDSSGNPNRYCVFVEEIFKNGWIRRRLCQNAKFASIKESKAERGSVSGYEVEMSFYNDAAHPGGQYHEWLIKPSA